MNKRIKALRIALASKDALKSLDIKKSDLDESDKKVLNEEII